MPTTDDPGDQAVTAMLPHARKLVDAVHSRDTHAVDGVLRVAHAIPLPAGVDPGRTLLLCVAELALASPPDVDDVAVERAVGGQLVGDGLNRPERAEAVRQLWTRGWPVRRIAEHLDLGRDQVAGILSHANHREER